MLVPLAKAIKFTKLCNWTSEYANGPVLSASQCLSMSNQNTKIELPIGTGVNISNYPCSKNQGPYKTRRSKAATQSQKQQHPQTPQRSQSMSQNESTNSAAALSLLDSGPAAMNGASISNIDRRGMANRTEGNSIST